MVVLTWGGRLSRLSGHRNRGWSTSWQLAVTGGSSACSLGLGWLSNSWVIRIESTMCTGFNQLRNWHYYIVDIIHYFSLFASYVILCWIQIIRVFFQESGSRSLGCSCRPCDLPGVSICVGQYVNSLEPRSPVRYKRVWDLILSDLKTFSCNFQKRSCSVATASFRSTL